ncbi:MAG: phage tail assembly chaperone, partial [Desulfobacteraceae bacterium]|nr:phage tail assembly chaperone [Desulfobacteraceae bacterium]
TTKAVWSPTDKTVQIVEKDEGVLTEQAWVELRRERDRLLAETDHTQLPDYPKKALYTAYRQELRDLPAKTTDPLNPLWPALSVEAEGYLRAKG